VDTRRYVNPDADPRGPWLASDLTAPSIRGAQTYEFHGHLPPTGRSWRYTAERMAELDAEGRIVLRKNGSPALKRYLADVAITEEAEPPPGANLVPPPVRVAIRELSRTLAHRLALAPHELSELEWRDLERVLGEVCEGLGFRTCVTRSGKDGGFDLELGADGATYLIEVKHWTAPDRVGAGQIAHFAEVVLSEGATRGLLLSTSGFRRAVVRERLEVAQHRVALGDGRKIIGLCQRYVEICDGVLVPETELAEVLFLDTY